jgi:predicted ribosomally synthesized peptide with SipW-like signal peptide
MRKGGVMHKMISKKILASVFVISMLAFAMGWGTYSYFSDTETSSGNKFSAGTLDLKVDDKDDPLGAYFSVSDVKPGDSGSKGIVLSNSGTLAGKAYIHFKNVVDSPGTTPESEPTPDYGELSKNLYIKVLVGGTVKAEGYLSQIQSNSYELGTIAGGGSLTVTIEWSIPSTVGNEIMDDSVTFDIEFSLVQA